MMEQEEERPITLADVMLLHAASIAAYGGGEGVRDMDALDGAINRPFATWDLGWREPV